MKASLVLPGTALSAMLALAACGVSPGQPTNGGSTQRGSSSAGATSGGASSTGATSSGTGGVTSGGTGATGSGSTSGGGAFEGCPDGWLSCVPSNICDNGCSPDGGACVDQLNADLAQTGVGCDAGAVCEGTICLTGSGPQVPNQNGGVLANPNIVIMTYDSDPNQSLLENWAVWIADGGYLETTVGQYGVGNGTVQFVRLADSEPDQNSIPQYLQTHFDSDPTMPAFASNNLYVIFFPTDWADTASFCQSQGGYHTYFQDSNGDYPIYAVIANCRDDLQGDTEVSGSHEIVEGTTNPYVGSWTFDNTASAWAYIGGELGDMCESNSDYYLSPDGSEAGQYIWSNSAAAAGQVPCQPWPDGVLYVDVLGSPALVPAAPGTTVNIPVTGWASAPVQSWGLVAQDAFFGVDFQTSPSLSVDTIAPGVQVMAELNIPQAAAGEPALGGMVGAAWIFSAVSDSAYYGSAMVGVTVSCETSGDCTNESYGCTVTDGGGSCGYAYCSASARPFSTCASSGTNDGVCLPFNASGGGSVEICNQAGSLSAGTTGCQTSRIVGADPAVYCDATSICEGSQNPTCFALCIPSDTTQGSCPRGQACIAQSSYYGYCVQDCSSTQPCPGGQTCYPTNQGVCYPT